MIANWKYAGWRLQLYFNDIVINQLRENVTGDNK